MGLTLGFPRRRPAAARSLGLSLSGDQIPGLAVRTLAAAVLGGCLARGHTIDQAIATRPEIADLAPRDRAFLMTLILTTLRRKGEAEAVVASFLDKPLAKRAGTAPLILTLAAVQLLFLDQPPHAVIDLAVRQAKADANARHFSGLVNAVLRKVAEHGAKVAGTLDGPRLNTPDWLWQRWHKTFGGDAAHAIAAAHVDEPPLDLSVKTDADTWASRLGGVSLPTGSIRLATVSGGIDRLPGFDDGAWWVQDAAAALPARLLGNVRNLDVLDICAAPGGKTLQLAAAGANVTALDQSAPRLERLRENLRRTGLRSGIVTADMLGYEAAQLFDAVLLDAPCSATGTIRRHPELPHIKDGNDISRLVPVQRLLLAKAATLVKPGGLLVFCTCSLEPAEGERHYEAFAGKHPNFIVQPVVPGEAGIPAHMITSEGFLRTLPSQSLGESRGLDGFFAMRLRRVV